MCACVYGGSRKVGMCPQNQIDPKPQVPTLILEAKVGTWSETRQRESWNLYCREKGTAITRIAPILQKKRNYIILSKSIIVVIIITIIYFILVIIVLIMIVTNSLMPIIILLLVVRIPTRLHSLVIISESRHQRIIHRNPQASQRPGNKAARSTPENPTHPKSSEHIPTHPKRK